MSENNVERLRTDTVWAEELRRDLEKPMAEIAEIMNRAKAAGYVVNFTFGADQYGRVTPPPITVLKLL